MVSDPRHQPVGELRAVRIPGGPSVLRSATFTTCPACGHAADAYGDTGSDDSERPTDGDYSICFRCGEVAMFSVGAFGIGVRAITTEELAAFSRTPHAARVRELHRFWAEHPDDKPGTGTTTDTS